MASVERQFYNIDFKETEPVAISSGKEFFAINLEYRADVTPQEIRDDIVSYLAEYRLKVPKYDYELVFSSDENGEYGLRDIYRGELLREKAKRAIKEREDAGLPVHREVNELFGIAKLDKELEPILKEEENEKRLKSRSIILTSPPGPSEQGYGDYGFMYYGSATEKEIDGKKFLHLGMTAVRIDNSPSLFQFNNTLKALNEKHEEKDSADQFLSSPYVLKGEVGQDKLNQILKKNFGFEEDEKEKQMFEKAIKQLNPLIDETVDIIRFGSAEDKVKAMNILENYSLKLEKTYKQKNNKNEDVLVKGSKTFIKDQLRTPRLADLASRFSHKPPVVRGSCGASGKVKSNGLLSAKTGIKTRENGLKTREFKFDQPGPCRLCGENVMCGPCQICESCNNNIDAQELAMGE